MVPPSQQGAYASPRLGVPFGEVQPPSSLSLMNSNSRNNKGSSPPARVPFRNRPFPCRGGRTGKSDAGLKSEYNATVEGLACSPVATILNGSAIATATPALHKARRSTPLVQWVWPLNTGASAAPRLSSENKGFGRQRRQQQQENPVRSQQKGVSGKTQQVSSVVTGKICEPVRPRRLDLSVTQGYLASSRVIYTAKGGYHPNPAVNAPPPASPTVPTITANASNKPAALQCSLPSPRDAPYLDSAGSYGWWGGSRNRCYSANSTSTAGMPSPRYLRSTTVSQAKAVESGGAAARAAGKLRAERSFRGSGTPRESRTVSSPAGFESDGGITRWANGDGWRTAGVLESLGDFLGIVKGGAGKAGTSKDAKKGKERGHTRDTPGKTVSSNNNAAGTHVVSKVLRRLKKIPDEKHAGYDSARLKLPKATAAATNRAPGADEFVTRRRMIRTDEREVLTMHTHGVSRPEGVKLRIVKASGRTLGETKFHMEIRTLRPGQVWSVCRRHRDFQNLHVCLQGRFPRVALPRLPPPLLGGVILEPATLERARARLQAYVGSLIADVPAAWGLEEFVMFLDSDEKGRRIFSRKRKKEARMSAARLSAPELNSRSSKSEEYPSGLASPNTGAPETQKTLLDLKVEEKKQALAALEDKAQDHFDGIGAVMNTAVSFSEDDDDDDLDFEEDTNFIDGEDAIRAMLDRDAEEAEDDNLFNIPAGTDFGSPLDNDDDIGDGFDIAYHG